MPSFVAGLFKVSVLYEAEEMESGIALESEIGKESG